MVDHMPILQVLKQVKENCSIIYSTVPHGKSPEIFPTSSLISNLRVFYGQAVMDYVMITGKINGTRGRQKQNEKVMDILT